MMGNSASLLAERTPSSRGMHEARGHPNSYWIVTGLEPRCQHKRATVA